MKEKWKGRPRRRRMREHYISWEFGGRDLPINYEENDQNQSSSWLLEKKWQFFMQYEHGPILTLKEVLKLTFRFDM